METARKPFILNLDKKKPRSLMLKHLAGLLGTFTMPNIHQTQQRNQEKLTTFYRPTSSTRQNEFIRKEPFRQITSKKSSRLGASVPFTTYVRRLATSISDGERKARIMSALAIGDGKALRERSRINDCRVGIRSVNGELKPFIRSCESRWCPHCARKHSKELQRELFKAFQSIENFGYGKWSWLTLTLNQRRLKNNSATEAFNAIRKNLTRLFNRPEWKAVVDGVYYKIEVTKSKEFYHFHAHLVVFHDSSRSELRKVIRKIWITAFAKNASGFIFKLKKFNVKSRKSLLEVTKYTAKELDMDVNDLASVVSATIGRRLNGATGNIKDMLASIRRKPTEKRAAPAPPRNCNSKTGEVHSLPAGSYSYQDLLAKVVNTQSESAVYALKLLAYRLRYGYRYEDALKAPEQ